MSVAEAMGRGSGRALFLSCVLTLCAGLLLAPIARGASVAVIDSGIDPAFPGLAGKIDPGIDFVDGDSNPYDEDPSRHGTIISRIIVGVDGRNRVLPIRVLDASGSTSSVTLGNGIDYAAASSAMVLNISIGDPSNRFNPVLTSDIQNAVRAGKLLVFAAGNESAPNPTYPASLVSHLAGGGIAVGALDRNGQIAWYSNRAGNARQYYLVAPGYSPYSQYIGTSFAAPYVSGTAAAILAQNPRLTAQQVSEIILGSADDMGAPGTDTIYGRGRLNTAAALAASGEVSTPSDSGGGSGIGAAALVVGGGVAAALIMKNRKLEETLVLDQYERPYQVDLEELITVSDETPGLSGLMQGLRRVTEASETRLGETTYLGVWFDRPSRWYYDDMSLAAAEADAVQAWSMSLQYGAAAGAWYALNMNLDPRQFFGAAEEVSPFAVFDRRSLTAPYAGFADDGDMLMSGYRFGNGVDLRLGAIDMDEGRDFGVRSRSVLFEGSARVQPGLRLALQLSALDEERSLLGGSSGGSLAVDGAGTLAAGLVANLDVTPDVSLQTGYSLGWTRVREHRDALLRDVTTLRSDTYGLGVQLAGAWAGDDALGITVSRPLQVNDGALTLSVPHDIDIATGRISHARERIDFAGVPRETDVELGYHLPLARGVGVAGYLMYRFAPEELIAHSGNGRYAGMLSLGARF